MVRFELMRAAFFRGCLFLILGNLGISILPVSAQKSASEEIGFPSGPSFQMPPGWKVYSFDEEQVFLTKPVSKKNPILPKPVLHARPLDESRKAKLSIVREFFAEKHEGPEAVEKIKTDLTGLAAQQGYEADSWLPEGRAKQPQQVIHYLVTAHLGDEQRDFVCVAINRHPEASYRCYWEYDSADEQTRSDFRAWLQSLKLDHVRIESVISGSASLPAGKRMEKESKEEGEEVGSLGEAMTLPQDLPPPSAEVAGLVDKYSPALIVVEGKNGMGSGFVCEIGGEKWLLTNIHVLADNPQPQFSRLHGEKIQPGAGFLAVGHDICKLAVPPETGSLPVLTPEDGEPKIGDAIAVLGNAEGAGVVKPLEGRIVGLGPNLIEVDAPFVPGNSGSPIIHVPTGKIIGIATYLITRSVNADGKSEVKTRVRRFGYRLDSVKQWEPVNWPRFYAQSAQLGRIESAGEDFVKLFGDTSRKEPLVPSNYQYPAIRRALETLQGRFSGTRLSESDRSFALREFFSNLRLATRNDVATFDTRTAYDFFRRQLDEEKKFREELYKGLTRALESKGR